jgi:hypothetical protein
MSNPTGLIIINGLIWTIFFCFLLADSMSDFFSRDLSFESSLDRLRFSFVWIFCNTLLRHCILVCTEYTLHLVMNVGFRVFDPVRAAITAVDYNQVFTV